MVTLIETDSYFDHVIQDVNAAHNRICIISLILSNDSSTEPLIQSLVRAAHRGVKVTIAADFSSQFYPEGVLSIAPRLAYQGFSAKLTDMIHRLTTAGVTFRWVSQTGIFMFGGRTHSKWVVIDSIAYVFGGINLSRTSLLASDYMLRLCSADLSDMIFREHHKILQADRRSTAARSRSYPTQFGRLLIDGGLPGDSIIYRAATKLAQKSTNTLLVTQYCPAGKLAAALRAVDYRIFYNSNRHFNDRMARFLTFYNQSTSQLTNMYRRDRYIHAKFMIATLPDGTKQAITGSHNFVAIGGLLGTREIALETTDPDIIRQLEIFYEKNIA